LIFSADTRPSGDFPEDIAHVNLPMATAIIENEFFGELRSRVRHDIRAMAGGKLFRQITRS
jgi:hypothetical protein